MTPAFWKGRRVLLTGHTGFKGAWLALLLETLGAEVTGLALPAPPGPALFGMLAPGLRLTHHIADLRDGALIRRIVGTARPSIVLHLGAQALVPAGYDDPAGTFATNLTGTINLLEAMRACTDIAAALIVTTDKVYRNPGDAPPFAEADPLGGADPYSASKAAAEVAVAAWRASFPDLPHLATARAGNVIGGGDFAPTRLIPDIVRAAIAGETLTLRYPRATRPFQHVLDVLRGYLLYAEALAGGAVPPSLNFAPDGAARVSEIVTALTGAMGADLRIAHAVAPAPEAPTLTLDSRLAAATLGWRARYDTAEMIAATAAWYAAWHRGEDMAARCRAEIAEMLT